MESDSAGMDHKEEVCGSMRLLFFRGRRPWSQRVTGSMSGKRKHATTRCSDCPEGVLDGGLPGGRVEVRGTYLRQSPFGSSNRRGRSRVLAAA